MQSSHISSKTQPMPTAFALDKDLQARLTALAAVFRQQPGIPQRTGTRSLEGLEAV